MEGAAEGILVGLIEPHPFPALKFPTSARREDHAS